MCLVAADARGIAISSTRAMARISVALSTTNSMISTAPAACSLAASSNKVVMSASFLLGLLDQRGQPVELFIGDVCSLLLDQRGHDVGGRAVEERGEQLIERREAHFFPVGGGEVHVTRAVMLMFHVALLLEDAERGADRRVAGRLSHGLEHFRGRGLAAGEDDVHHLPLATTEAFR